MRRLAEVLKMRSSLHGHMPAYIAQWLVAGLAVQVIKYFGIELWDYATSVAITGNTFTQL